MKVTLRRNERVGREKEVWLQCAFRFVFLFAFVTFRRFLAKSRSEYDRGCLLRMMERKVDIVFEKFMDDVCIGLVFYYTFSVGLFHRVVLLSGTALSPWATMHNPDSLRVSIGQQTGCLSSTDPGDEDIAPCLRTRWVHKIFLPLIPNIHLR